ncbi:MULTISPECIES: globin domain-containing protein [unclassified Halobacteriovorax]|uniref:globin domain-containing protein n=1 Tax=unclassified Halobacteriovorax TaxID=2639665 RepID=UPI00399AAE8D
MNFDKDLIIESFARIEPNLKNFTNAFFDNVVILEPGMQKVFAHADREQLKASFIRALSITINNLKNPEYLKYYLQGLGGNQIKYEVSETFFPIFEEAFIQTLMLFHMNSWTPKLETAWRDCFYYIAEYISDGMVDATLRREFEEFLEKKEHVDSFKKAA